MGAYCSQISFTVLSILLIISTSLAQSTWRNEINLPDILGYTTLVCDFHTHTVFSDGNVWPTVRVLEAWREGLDAIALTDHLEDHPYEEDVIINLERPHQIALPEAVDLNLFCIKGAEITKKMPPGHFNALFLTNASALKSDSYQDALKAAMAQGAFIIWNHPGWQQPEEKGIWYKEHTEIYNNGWMHGIEIVNEKTYYPQVQAWAMEKNLTMIGGSDIHGPTDFEFRFETGDHRTCTLVFAKDKSEAGIKEALFARRTAVWVENKLIGEELYLKPIFFNSIDIINPQKPFTPGSDLAIRIRNHSDLSYELIASEKIPGWMFPRRLILPANKTTYFYISSDGKLEEKSTSLELPYTVQNLFVAPSQGMKVFLKVQVLLK